MISDEEAQAAKDRLQTAISEYFRTVDPDVYVPAWVLVTEKDSIELTRENLSLVGHLTPTGQSWALTVGLLTIAHDNARCLTTDAEE